MKGRPRKWRVISASLDQKVKRKAAESKEKKSRFTAPVRGSREVKMADRQSISNGTSQTLLTAPSLNKADEKNAVETLNENVFPMGLKTLLNSRLT